jgi:hypothetical protein
MELLMLHLTSTYRWPVLSNLRKKILMRMEYTIKMMSKVAGLKNSTVNLIN